MNDLEQFKQTFITECFELLVDMEERLMALDCDVVDTEQLNAIFRCAHSIKGGSGAFGLSYITNFTHVLEALLDSMREGKINASREVVNTLLKAADIVTQMVHCAKDNITPDADLGKEVMTELQLFVAGTPGNQPVSGQTESKSDETSTTKLFHITFAPHENIFATGNEPLLILRELARLGKTEITAYTHRIAKLSELPPTQCMLGWSIELHTDKPLKAVEEVFEFVTDYCDLKINEIENLQAEIHHTSTEAKKVKIAATGEEQGNKATATTSIRVDLEKIDRLVNMIGELVITEAMLKAQTRDFVADQFSGLLRGIEELSQHTREIQEAVMSVRMQPVKSIFSRMPRIVRDISTMLNKDIRLITAGENTEVDKTVIESLSDPLTHMIRNSCDHGIEKPDVRIKNGKPEQGTICLSADHRGGRIIIEIRDDGAGINREKVLTKAKEKGLVPAEVELDNETIDNLIFLPGFSTADVVSNVSGRGVGMDVVKRNIEGLGGTVRVTTEPGKGSVFTVSLPLTLAILDGMIVRVGAEFYIIPITSIIETMRPKSDDVKRVEGHNDVINVRGEYVPVIHLARIFNIKNAEADPSKALVVLVESSKQKMGLVVDELVGQQQVVIKSLATNSDPVKGISGATILGDGRVSLILEINDLAKLTHIASTRVSLGQAA